MILSHALWQQRFGSDPSVIGRSIELDGVGRQVVGVMPPDFRFPSTKRKYGSRCTTIREILSTIGKRLHAVIGRLRPGATPKQAQGEIRIFQSHVGPYFPANAAKLECRRQRRTAAEWYGR